MSKDFWGFYIYKTYAIGFLWSWGNIELSLPVHDFALGLDLQYSWGWSTRKTLILALHLGGRLLIELGWPPRRYAGPPL